MGEGGKGHRGTAPPEGLGGHAHRAGGGGGDTLGHVAETCGGCLGLDLAPTPPLTFWALRGSWVPQHTYLKIIPLSR